MKLFTHFSTLLVVLLLMATTTSITAQITITRADYPVQFEKKDSFYRANFDLAYPEPGIDQTFDYSTVEYLPEISITDLGLPPNDTLFPNANRANFREADFQGFPLTNIEYIEESDTASSVLGIYRVPVAYPLTAVTGSPADSIFFLESVLNYGTSPLHRRQFPLNYQDSWSKTFQSVTPFALTVAAFGLNNTPGSSVQDATFSYEVMASGNLIVPSESGEALGSIPVLVVRSDATRLDNYTLGGAPAPAALLTAFGLTQGATTIESPAYTFYSPGLGSSVAVLFPENEILIVNINATSVVSSVKDVQLVEGKFYPNPVAAGRQLFVQTQEPINAQLLQLVNMSGQVVNSRALDAQSTDRFDIDVPASLPSGMYFMRVISQSGKLMAVAKIDIAGR